MRSAKNIEKLVKNLKLSIDTNTEVDQKVLGELLHAQVKSHRTELAFALLKTRRRKMLDRSRTWKVAAVLAIVIGAGALAAVGLKARKYYFERETDGDYNIYNFISEPETIELEDGSKSFQVRTYATRSNDPNFTIDVEQKKKDFEEIDSLRQNDDREMRVTEIEVNGKPQTRTYAFKYTLSDGREFWFVEDTQDCGGSLTETQQDEVASLLRAGKYEKLNSQEKEMKGRLLVFERQRFILSDGTEVIKSIGKPE